MSKLLTPGLVDVDNSDDESTLAPLVEAGLTELEEEEGSLDQDIYCLVIKSLVRDLQVVFVGDKATTCFRYSRLMLSLGTLLSNMIIQVFILWFAKTIMTTQSVGEMRKVWDAFILGMDQQEDQGIADQALRFERLGNASRQGKELQEKVCSISLIRPIFLGLCLTIWAILCLAEVKRVYELWQLLIAKLPQAARASAQLAIVGGSGEEEDPERTIMEFRRLGFTDMQANALLSMVSKENAMVRARRRDQAKVIVISGMTVSTKVLVSVVVLLPRLSLALVSLVMGCRWLTATLGQFGILAVLVALRFIINLKDLLFNIVVSAHEKANLARLKVHQPRRLASANCWIFVGAFFWFSLAVTWAILYMFYFQTVLPGWRWHDKYDIRDICQAHWEALYAHVRSEN